MPIYEFVCGQCGHEFEKILSFSATTMPSCVSCGDTNVERQMGRPAIHFKGSGWYINDSKKGNAKKGNNNPASAPSDAEGDSSSAETKSEATGSDEGTGTETKATDSSVNAGGNKKSTGSETTSSSVKAETA